MVSDYSCLWLKYAECLTEQGYDTPFVVPDFSALSAYVSLLAKWNAVHDLVAEASEDTYFEAHVCDALAALWVLLSSSPHVAEAGTYQVIDIGSGAGLPGLVWALACPSFSRICLLEPREKRVSFLKQVIQELGLQRVEVIKGRFDREALPIINSMTGTLGNQWVSTMRALKPDSKMVRLFESFSSPDSCMTWLGAQEKYLDTTPEASYFSARHSYRLPSGQERNLLVRPVAGR